MKLGIFTFHCAHNYGAVLQAYALQEYLRMQGHDVSIINYQPEYLIKAYKIIRLNRCFSKNPLKVIKRTLRETALLKSRISRFRKFDSFIQNKLKLCKIDLNEINHPFDVFIFGSDQIWNPHISRNQFDKVFFAQFRAAEKVKKITYAASMGSDTLSKEEADYFESALKRFDALSVRESSLQNMLSLLTDKNIKLVLDPTLMLPAHSYDEIAIRPSIQKPYVLVYQTVLEKKIYKIANSIARQINGIVIEVAYPVEFYFSRNKKIEVSPEEFLGYIKHAACIVTTSFHGVAFSIIFKKDFYVLKLNSLMDTRSESLLETLSLLDRFIEKDQKTLFTPINYSEIKEKLALLQQSSKDFLEQAL